MLVNKAGLPPDCCKTNETSGTNSPLPLSSSRSRSLRVKAKRPSSSPPRLATVYVASLLPEIWDQKPTSDRSTGPPRSGKAVNTVVMPRKLIASVLAVKNATYLSTTSLGTSPSSGTRTSTTPDGEIVIAPVVGEIVAVVVGTESWFTAPM